MSDKAIYEIKENKYNAPLKRFVRSNKEKEAYNLIYNDSRLHYYTKISWAFLKRKVRKSWRKNLINMLTMSLGLFILYKLHIDDYLRQHITTFFYKIYYKIRGRPEEVVYLAE